MRNILEKILLKILKSFFAINLSATEKGIAIDSVRAKYVPAIEKSFWCSLLLLPGTIFLDLNILVTVLIPITMVSGTAWFAVSLANIKKKFENFGNELTRNLFASFSLSLFALFLITVSAMLPAVGDAIQYLVSDTYLPYINIISGLLAIYVTSVLLYDIFIGALKYDTNDAMLSGQNEAAEKYYKNALSLLHRAADGIAESRSLQVSNYLIGVALFEIFAHIKSIKKTNGVLGGLMEESNKLVFNPSMSQAEADTIVVGLLRELVLKMNTDDSVVKNKSYQAIMDEIECLQKNKNEDQEMVDTRLSVVFRELASLLEDYGEFLFADSAKL